MLAEKCLCFSTHCLGLSSLSCQDAIVFWFHGCYHHLQWFRSPRRTNLSLLPPFHFYLPCINEARCHDLSFLIFSLKPALSLSSFTLLKRLFSSALLSAIGEGNGNPLQDSCLENPMDGGAWWATVHGSQRVGHDWVTSLSLSAIRMVSSVYLRLLMFLPPILIQACNLSIQAFLMMHSMYRLNKQGDRDSFIVLLSWSWTNQFFHTLWIFSQISSHFLSSRLSNNFFNV